MTETQETYTTDMLTCDGGDCEKTIVLSQGPDGSYTSWLVLSQMAADGDPSDHDLVFCSLACISMFASDNPEWIVE